MAHKKQCLAGQTTIKEKKQLVVYNLTPAFVDVTPYGKKSHDSKI